MGRFAGASQLAKLLSASIAVIGLLIPVHANAGGFQNIIQSAAASGVAGAGAAAIAEDAATIFYNPAGMALLEHRQAVAALGTGFPQSSFQNRGTTDALGSPVLGSTDVGSNAAILPSFFASTPITDRLQIGVGAFVPFGQATKYSNDWVGRYQVQQTTLKTYDIDPAVAYRMNDWFAVGAGIDFQIAQFNRRNAIDFGAACLVGLAPATCGRLGLAPQRSDGRLAVHLDDWNVGYNLGVLIEPSSDTRVGASYRSSVQHGLSGSAEFTVPSTALPLTASGAFQNTGAAAILTFPDTVGFGISQVLTDQLTLLAGFNWTFWSSLNQLSLSFINPAQPTINQPLHWHDSFRVSVGGQYRLSQGTKLRAGFAFDQSPIPVAFRTADLPGADTIELSAGFDQRIDERLTFTMSYAYDRGLKAPLNLTVTGAGTLVGTMHSSYHSVGLQLTLAF